MSARYFYHYGFLTRQTAQDMLEHHFASGEISEGEHPVVKRYRTTAGTVYWGIEIDG